MSFIAIYMGLYGGGASASAVSGIYLFAETADPTRRYAFHTV